MSLMATLTFTLAWRYLKNIFLKLLFMHRLQRRAH